MTGMKPVKSMTPCDVQASGAIELWFYGELDPDERRRIEFHLAVCAECRGALDELKTIRTALATRPVVTAPPGDDWTSLMSRIDVAIAHESRSPAKVVAMPPRSRPVPAYLAMAAVLTLVTASVTYLARHRESRPVESTVATRVEAPSTTVAPLPAADPGAPASAPQSDPFAAISEQHFERSKLVILGLASRDPHNSSSSDWAYERQLAGALLDDTRLYKQAAEARGLGSLAGVMSDLELVLLQTSLSDQGDAATLDRLQRLIRRRDLVSKMEMTRF
jgi:putative zinc finger protein